MIQLHTHARARTHARTHTKILHSLTANVMTSPNWKHYCNMNVLSTRE